MYISSVCFWVAFPFLVLYYGFSVEGGGKIAEFLSPVLPVLHIVLCHLMCHSLQKVWINGEICEELRTMCCPIPRSDFVRGKCVVIRQMKTK